MADVLALLRQFNLQKKEIIERDDLVIFDQLAWSKHAKTNYTVYRGKDATGPSDYYTLEALLFLLKNLKLPHPLYVTRASGQGIPTVRHPDRKELLQYLNGEIETTASIDKSAPLEVPQAPPSLKRAPEDIGSEAKRPRFEPRPTKMLSETAAPKSAVGSLVDHKSSTISEVISIDRIAAIKRKVLAKKRQATIRQGEEEFKTDGLREYGADAVADIVSRERQHRTRSSVLQSAGKSFENLLVVLQSVRAREEGRVPELGRPDTHKDPPSRASKAPPNRTELGYNRYDQERFSSTQDALALGFEMNTKASFYGLTLQSVTEGAQKMNPLTTQTKPQAPKSETPDSQASPAGKSPRPKKESRVPIIVVPSAPTALVTMLNAKELLQDLHFVSNEEKKKAGTRRESETVIIRRRPDPDHSGGSLSVPYLVLDNPVKLHPQDWRRVVAVFVAGQQWQFKGWPGLTPDGSPVNIFAKTKAFHLKYEEVKLDANIRKWDVQVLSVSKLKRHLDKVAVMKFWETLDRFMTKNCQHLRF